MACRAVVVGFVFGLALALAGGAAAGSAPPLQVPHGRALSALGSTERVLIGVHAGRTARRLLSHAGARLVSLPGRLWLVDGPTAKQLIPELEARGVLRYAEPDRPLAVAGHLDQGDPLLSRAWQIAKVGADASEPPKDGVPLAILDTGLDIQNPDFAGRSQTTLENPQSIGPFQSEEYHGTIVASTAAAAVNGLGTVGIQPYVPLRIWDAGTLEDSDLIPELDQAALGCPQVVNMSFGGEENTRAFYEAVMRLVQAGCLVVASAGNSFFAGSPTEYPANTPHVLTVGATDQSDQPAAFSSRGQAIDLAAPGTDIPVQDPTDPTKFALADGTSFSAPIVSAAASWVWTLRPKLDASQLYELLRNTAADVFTPGFDARTGFGIVKIPRALAGSAPKPDPGEPNDDIDLVKAGGVFPTAKPLLGRLLSARLDAANDPIDVYRVTVPKGTTLTATLATGRPLAFGLWRSTTRSVLGSVRDRIAVRSHPIRGREAISYRNAGRSAATLYLEVMLGGGRGGVTAAYTLSTKTS